MSRTLIESIRRMRHCARCGAKPVRKAISPAVLNFASRLKALSCAGRAFARPHEFLLPRSTRCREQRRPRKFSLSGSTRCREQPRPRKFLWRVGPLPQATLNCASHVSHLNREHPKDATLCSMRGETGSEGDIPRGFEFCVAPKGALLCGPSFRSTPRILVAKVNSLPRAAPAPQILVVRVNPLPRAASAPQILVAGRPIASSSAAPQFMLRGHPSHKTLLLGLRPRPGISWVRATARTSRGQRQRRVRLF